MRVAIVGGAGFIGCALAATLRADDAEPVLFDIPDRLAATADLLPGVARVAFDFSSDDDGVARLRGFDALAHLGATTTPAHSMASMQFDARSNIAPSLRLFEAAASAGIGRVVFASSGGTVYGAPSRLPVDEDAPTRPLSAYGVSKVAIENYLAIVPGIDGVSLRVANPYGPFQLRGAAIGVIAHYARRLAQGLPFEVWGDGSVVRDYIAIDDVAAAFVAALRNDQVFSGAYNVGSGTGTRLDAIIALLFDTAGRRVPVNYLPARNFDVPAIVLDSARLRAVSDWRPQVELEAGVRALWQRALHDVS